MSADATNDNAVVADRRSSSRQRVLLSGKIAFLHNSFSSDCRLRDLSRHGAQIVVTSNDTVDKDACLIVVRDGTVHQTTTVWTDGLRRGVRFVDTFALTSGVPTHLLGMRRLWLENLPR